MVENNSIFELSSTQLQKDKVIFGLQVTENQETEVTCVAAGGHPEPK